MRWQLRWAKNALFGMAPFSGTVRRIKRRLRPYPTKVSEWTLEEGLRQTELLREGGCILRGSTILEFGSGWQPTIPLLFSLAGASRVVMADTQRLMDAATFSGTARSLVPHAEMIAQRLHLEESIVREALAGAPCDLEGMLAHFRLDYVAPCDVTSTRFSEETFDVVTSRAVLEHVPASVLRPLLGRVLNLLRPGGYTCHAIDNSDHWSHKDRRLSRVNFLRFSDQRFDFLNRFNPLDYQNRLRHPEYAALLCDLGFQVIISRSDPEPQALADLQTLPLSPRFRDIPAAELAKLDSYFVARRPLTRHALSSAA